MMAKATHTQTVNMGDGNVNCNNITGSFNNFYKSDEDVQIMRWLSPLEPSHRHQGVRSDRFDGVGDWFLETSEFRKWRGCQAVADEAVLFCSGNPGVGKTFLSSLVVDKLCDEAEEDIAVTCFYCDYKAHQEQTIPNIIGAILKQLVRRRGIPEYLREAFHKGKQEIGGRGLRLPDLMGMLSKAIASLSKVFICIDALDECLPNQLPELLRSLGEIVQAAPKTRILLTARPHIKDDILRYFPKTVVIPISPNTKDIENYVETRLSGDCEPEAMNDDLRADIMKIIKEKISDIFLLVSLNMDAILGEVTIRQRRKKLEEMTGGNGLSNAYRDTLTRLKAQKGIKSVLGVKVLMWVLYSERPLGVEELRHALGVELGSVELDVENVPASRTLVASSLGLVTVEASSSTLRLVHFTLQEHLLNDPTLFPNPHSEIAEVCLTYLTFGSVCDLSPTLRAAPSAVPLLEYASCYWGSHTTRGVTENVKTLALRLLDRFNDHISAQLLLLRSNIGHRRYFRGEEGPVGFTGLHGAAFLGIVEIIASVTGMEESDVNATDGMGITALIWAASNGHEGAVEVLLQQGGVNPDQADTGGRTPLSWAAANGLEGIVEILLQREDVNPDQVDTGGRTPLSWVAGNGHEGVLKLLLQREGVNPAPDDAIGRTPLSWAAENGHEGIVEILLQREDVNPDQADTGGRTPLSWAAKNGHGGVATILLQREGVNPNQEVTRYGQTPLSWAAENGHAGVVRLLLQREGVNPDQPDTIYRQTPLSWAAENGHEGIVRILLQRSGVNSDQADTNGRTPLLWAAKNGHEGVVKILLQSQGVNPNAIDTEFGVTPLWWAAARGHGAVVKILLQQLDVHPDQGDTNYGRTPLWWAALRGYEGIVRLLLQRQEVNPNTVDAKGRTPLSWAAKRGGEGVVKMLLERGCVLTSMPDNHGQTPLSLALSEGKHLEIVKILQEQEKTNSDPLDPAGQAPLPPSTEHADEWMVPKIAAPDPDIADPDAPPATASTHPNEQEAISGVNNTPSESTDSDPPSTEPSMLL